jgi:hypothetical protein
MLDSYESSDKYIYPIEKSMNKHSKFQLSNIDFNNNRSSTRNKKYSKQKPCVIKSTSHLKTYLPNKSISKKKENNKSSQQICWFSMSTPWLKRINHIQNNDIILNTNPHQQILYAEFFLSTY